jgi:hypothetical protein
MEGGVSHIILILKKKVAKPKFILVKFQREEDFNLISKLLFFNKISIISINRLKEKFHRTPQKTCLSTQLNGKKRIG